MTRNTSKTTTGWRKRYLVLIPGGHVWLLRGRGKKGEGGVVRHQILVEGKWDWQDIRPAMIVDSEAQLAALRLQGFPIKKEPRWVTYS